jgi:hypothetical protein
MPPQNVDHAKARGAQSFKTRKVEEQLAPLRAMLTRATALIQLKDVPVALPVNVLKGLKKGRIGGQHIEF